MIEGREFDLLADIAKLLRKYGPEAFETLANSLASPNIAQSLVDVLSRTATIASKQPASNRSLGTGKGAGSILDELAYIEPKDPQKHRLLATLYQALQDKSVLPTLRELKNFATDCGLPVIKADARQRAIGPLMRSLFLLPREDLEARIKTIESYSRNDKGLERWSEIILGKDSAVKPE